MIEISALFIGGPADGQRHRIDARMSTIQIPNKPEPLTLEQALEWTGWQGPPPELAVSITTYVVHLRTIPGYGTVAICTADFDLDWPGILVKLLDNYRPGA